MGLWPVGKSPSCDVSVSQACLFLRFLAKGLHEPVSLPYQFSRLLDSVWAWEYQPDQSYGACNGPIRRPKVGPKGLEVAYAQF